MNNTLTALGHDIRNPLAALSYGIELLRQHGKVGIKQLNRMDRQIFRLARMADNLPNIPCAGAADPPTLKHVSHPLLYLHRIKSQSDSVDESSAAS